MADVKEQNFFVSRFTFDIRQLSNKIILIRSIGFLSLF